jgi:phosphohistidine phosphatase
MKLYVMRHAQASFNAPSDRERPLTENGIQQTRELINLHNAALADVNLLWSSDLLRARQTAALVAEVLGFKVVEKTCLTPDGHISDVLNELHGLRTDDILLMVSHQPLVGELVSYLVSGNIYQAHPFTTSEMLELEFDYAGPAMARLCKQYLPG